MRRLRALQSDRYVIGLECGQLVRKLFQIIPARDGSLYVAFPYSPLEVGRVGIITMKAGKEEEGIIFGDNDPVTAEKVKYSHHPSGNVHFSQSGRVRTDIRKTSVPFGRISGHIFTVTFQGIDRYKSVPKSSRNKPGSIIAAFAAPERFDGAYKFVAHVHSEVELARRIFGSGTGLWIRAVNPSGKVLWSITLATKFQSEGGRRFVMLSLEPVEKVCAQYDELLMFVGGFDPPEVSMDVSKDTQALMMLYSPEGCTDELLQRVGTIDLQNARTRGPRRASRPGRGRASP